MELSVFLARLLGLYMLIMFVLLATRRDEMLQGIKAVVGNHGLLMTAGAISLLSGLAILIGHPVWIWNWSLVITLLGAIMVVQGILRLGYPAVCADWINAIMRHKNGWSWMMIITLIIGLYLISCGFMR